MNYYLIGIYGAGMSALAQILVHEGHSVSGSDRNSDSELLNKFKELGVKVFKQDGSAVDSSIDRVVISRAIEDSNKDLVKARKLKLPVSFRQDVLKELFRHHSGIAVAGTSGKTTVTGMIGCILDSVGCDLTIINGGIIKKYNNNVKIGKESYWCIETDESEGDLCGFYPKVGVLTNIGSDHMTRSELIKVYMDFINEIKDVLVINSEINLDRPAVKTVTFGIKDNADLLAKDIELFSAYSLFNLNGYKVKVPLPGLYNIYNALAAIGAANAWGVPIKDAVSGIASFSGIKRRLDILGVKNGITVVDDYAHNPDKIKAILSTVKLKGGRIIVIYQPHGYKPTKMFFNELVNVFALGLDRDDFLFMPEIYYAGGEVRKDISSCDVLEEIKSKNKDIKTNFFSKKEDIVKEVCHIVKSGDTVLIMGARDRKLPELGQLILDKV